MSIELIKIGPSEKSVLRRMVELYNYDVSEYAGDDLNEHGYFGYSRIDHYWTEQDRYPYFIRCDGALAGFVLVNSHSYTMPGQKVKSIAEFFVMRKYRRNGIGKKIALQVFDMFRGKWEVNQIPENTVACAFWETIISEYSGGKYEKRMIDTESGKRQSIIFNNTV
ncbi:MAG: GNAT family N-acetyltransferase [Spirochaetales bacterium]|nr:GNAT family N-acetyltransferase [Spirochaetales bacterium]